MEGKWTQESDENMSLTCPLWAEDKISLNSGLAVTEDGLGVGVTIGGQAWHPSEVTLSPPHQHRRPRAQV